MTKPIDRQLQRTTALRNAGTESKLTKEKEKHKEQKKQDATRPSPAPRAATPPSIGSGAKPQEKQTASTAAVAVAAEAKHVPGLKGLKRQERAASRRLRQAIAKYRTSPETKQPSRRERKDAATHLAYTPTAPRRGSLEYLVTRIIREAVVGQDTRLLQLVIDAQPVVQHAAYDSSYRVNVNSWLADDHAPPRGETALHLAARLGNMEALEVLLSCHDSGHHAYDPVTRVLMRDPRYSPSMLQGGVKAVPVLDHPALLGLTLKPSLMPRDLVHLNAISSGGATPLLLALTAGQSAAARRLIECGANVDATDLSGLAPVHCVAKRGDLELYRLLRQHDAKRWVCTRTSKSSPLHMAVAHDAALPIVQDLADMRVVLLGKDSRSRSALMISAERGRADYVSALLALGALGNAVDHQGDDAMMMAIRSGHRDVAWTLLTVGKCSPHTSNKSGITALHLAARAGDARLVAELLRRQAKAHAVDQKRHTPLHAACSPMPNVPIADSVTVLKTLLAAPTTNPEARDSDGNTAADVCFNRVLKDALVEAIRDRPVGPVTSSSKPAASVSNPQARLQQMALLRDVRETQAKVARQIYYEKMSQSESYARLRQAADKKFTLPSAPQNSATLSRPSSEGVSASPPNRNNSKVPNPTALPPRRSFSTLVLRQLLYRCPRVL
ncbi:hypothetical protein CAOG_03862 [Capsaspora owczarzaki ATCC 30864]|uniref:Uncharacterized protein n=1 Tax=Capsaspora owczarzaki (strain ATCC 30864) TaxID=595528 RepID=A0A0D2UD55_CAPO3|nr:hypothetical protein CAOG_03862 [Capsaspora owczarzaki ATCC 30864]KJE92996.1 hypothetical protein CAOG_003862 [Capsaspora owczarzaki ATCC 30864]|eukprot:XP_004363590.1 hypothetical protein CAOG_03862 [Capsaspora owczarzaki ATCC 30864]